MGYRPDDLTPNDLADLWVKRDGFFSENGSHAVIRDGDGILCVHYRFNHKMQVWVQVPELGA